MPSALNILHLTTEHGTATPGLVAVRDPEKNLRVDEQAAVLQAQLLGDIDYIFFRRFADGRSSFVAAYVIDNGSYRFSEGELAKIHHKLWLNGSAPLLYVGWPSRIDILSCARGPDFWKNGAFIYKPAETLTVAAQISKALAERLKRFSAQQLSDGTFWEDPENTSLANADAGAHRRLIAAVVETDQDLGGETKPHFRHLLLLTVLIKYLEDRTVFPDGWYSDVHPDAATFLDLLRSGTPDQVRKLLGKLERKFNGDVFSVPDHDTGWLTARDLKRFADLVEARTLDAQRYLWDQYSFKHLPVEVLSHLYQRFAQPNHGAVFTPPFVANLMLDYAMPYESLTGNERVIDPTCGSGVFLVGAFRRLIQVWRSKNEWAQPTVVGLKQMLRAQIFGVEMQAEALRVTAFNLALAVCDALQPNVIWKELRFEKLVGSNLLAGDFFEALEKLTREEGPKFDLVLGNPPFLSRLTPAAEKFEEQDTNLFGPAPDRQIAYAIAHASMRLLRTGGRLCVIQPAGFIYNENTTRYRNAFMAACRFEAVLDFSSIRNLYDGADPKTVAIVVANETPGSAQRLHHLTFRRSFSVLARIAFELDHYDRHQVSAQLATDQPWIWRANLLGGGRLVQLATRLKEFRPLAEFIQEKGWDYGEGFIVGETGNRQRVKWLTGLPLLPTDGLGMDGIDWAKVTRVKETEFKSFYTEERYSAPLVLIKENLDLPCDFLEDGKLAYRDKIVGIHAPLSEKAQLRSFFREFRQNRECLRAACLLFSSQALVGKATAILKRDLDQLPWPESGNWDLSDWEIALCEDLVEYTAEMVRIGQNSQLLSKRANASALAAYSEMFCNMLGDIYDNLRPAKTVHLFGLVCQAFCFGKAPEIDWSDDWTNELDELVHMQHGDAVRTTRMLRLYEHNVIFLLKPNLLRYWTRSAAIRDADETLVDLRQQGY